MKTFEFTTSILQHTNRAVSSTEESWAGVRENSYIQFGLGEPFYTVGKINPLFYVKNFTCESHFSSIRVNGDCGINISTNDTLQISYKEYELLTVVSCLTPGKHYKVGEVIGIKGGRPVVNKVNNEVDNASFLITKVNEEGGILQIQLQKRGRYYEHPPKESVVDGFGEGAVLRTEFRTIDTRAIIEKTALSVNKNGSFTEVFIDSPLPEGIKEGEVSVKKWEMFLTSNYVGDDKINADYHIVRDFSPNLRIPFLAPGTKNPEAIYNLAIEILDKRFKELLDKNK